MGDKALLRACREMREAEKRDEWEAAEIVGTRAQYWLGDRRVSARTVDLGSYGLLFHSEGIGTDYERHTLNSHGREYADTGKLPRFDFQQEQSP